jgi:hypothetical protein
MSTEDFLNFKNLSKDIGTNFNMDVNGKKICGMTLKKFISTNQIHAH